MDAARARELLEAERERLLRLRADSEAAHEETAGELASVDQHPADMATETFDRQREQSVLDHLDEQVREVDAALQRVENGTYGVCEGTGELIPDERLEAMPTARYTVAYQQELERQGGQG